jgi:4-azaleucine resistance transporter AzlC
MQRILSANRSRAFRAAFEASVPVLLGYLAIGLAFGILFAKAGFAWWLAPVMSALVYAGAAQYMAVGLLQAGTGIAEIALLTLVVNARHMVYGLSLLERFKDATRFKPYLVFALTDETYGILTTVAPPSGSTAREREDFYLALSLLDQSYWVLGSAIGAVAGGLMSFDSRGLDFALTALFVVLLVEQTRTVRRPGPYLVAAAGAAHAFLAPGPAHLHLVSVIAAIGGLIIIRRRLP